jgi:hypothetical protein
MARSTSRAVLALAAALAVTGCGQEPSATPSGEAGGTVSGMVAAAAVDAPVSGEGIRSRDQGPKIRRVKRLGQARSDRGHLRLTYSGTSDEVFSQYEQSFREERLFEDMVEELDRSLVLPRDIGVRVGECGDANAFYDPDTQTIELCYELLGYFVDIFSQQLDAQTDEEWEEVGVKSVAALIFVFYHELGHALIDVLNLPITGREEDAVDQLATVMLLETWEGEDSELAILSSAEWFGIDAGMAEELDMADEHSLDEQRYYNLVCWIYGSDTEYFEDVAYEWELPDERAAQCEGEYTRMSASWDALLSQHFQAAG